MEAGWIRAQIVKLYKRGGWQISNSNYSIYQVKSIGVKVMSQKLLNLFKITM